MSDMKCPVCNQPLHDDHDGYYSCYSDNCCVSGGTLDTWQELDRWKQSAEDHQNWLRLAEKRLERTRKALEIAVDALKSAKARLELINNSKFANLNNVLQIQSQCEILKIEKSLEQITALEQKE